jgi:hypothetical protein
MAPLVVERGREWLSWCGEWVLGPFPLDYQERIRTHAKGDKCGLDRQQTGD